MSVLSVLDDNKKAAASPGDRPLLQFGIPDGFELESGGGVVERVGFASEWGGCVRLLGHNAVILKGIGGGEDTPFKVWNQTQWENMTPRKYPKNPRVIKPGGKIEF